MKKKITIIILLIMTLSFLFTPITDYNVNAFTKINIDTLEIDKITKQTYTGKEITPSVTIKNNENYILKEDKDYTLSYSNNTNIGTGYIHINGINDYTGDMDIPFEIISKITTRNIKDISSFLITYNDIYEYTGKEIKPQINVSEDGDSFLTLNKDYTISYENNKNIGSGKIIVCGINDYSGEVKKDFEIIDKISISNYSTKIRLKASKTLKDTVIIHNAYGRTIELQKYNETTKKWETLTSVKCNNEKEDKQVIEYPSSWKKQTYSSWRLYIKGEEGKKEFISNKISLVAKNRKELKLSAKSAIIYCIDNNEVIYDKSMHTRRPNASTTKIMTGLLVIQNDKMNKKVKISKKASKTPYGNLNLKKGDKVYVKNLLNALLISSSNDAAVALAETTSGSTTKFAKKMNAKAKALGCKDTNFVTSNGLHAKNHYSSAYDLALIQKAALKSSRYRRIIKRKSYRFKSIKRKQRCIVYTTDSLLGRIKGFLGGKTGYHSQARQCFVGTYEYKGKTYVTVVLGCSKSRWSDTRSLIRYVKAFYK